MNLCSQCEVSEVCEVCIVRLESQVLVGHTQGIRSFQFWGLVCILIFESEVFSSLCSKCEVAEGFLRVSTKVLSLRYLGDLCIEFEVSECLDGLYLNI